MARRCRPTASWRDQEIEILIEWVDPRAPWPTIELATAPVEWQRLRDHRRGPRVLGVSADRRSAGARSRRHATGRRRRIDHFILAQLEEAGLAPSPPADKRTLIRRATFDLTGLPPTREEIDAFLADDSPEAFARVVDRLLASPHYGERWARHWLDVARYGEDQAHTFEARLYPQGFRYRDWVVGALNDDMPYDEFVRQQIAADLIGGGDAANDDLPALGLLRHRAGVLRRPQEARPDRRPHRHAHARPAGPDRRVRALPRSQVRSDLDGRLLRAGRRHGQHRVCRGAAGVGRGSRGGRKTEEDRRLKESKEKKKKNAPPPYALVHAIRDAEPRDMPRAHPRQPGNAGRRSAAAIPGDARRRRAGAVHRRQRPAGAGRRDRLPRQPADGPRDRQPRVEACTSAAGWSRTPSNFGRLGEPPTHPELLDHLASRFIDVGLVAQVAAPRDHALGHVSAGERLRRGAGGVDPDNRLLWRMNRRRLDVEAWRDAILAVAGTLDLRLGGPSLELADADNRRRTLYARVSRHNLDPLLRLFDFPDPNITSDGRPVTTVPLQQLFVLNSGLMAERRKALAARCCAAETDEADRIRFAFEVTFGRPATESEVQLAANSSANHRQRTMTRPA